MKGNYDEKYLYPCWKSLVYTVANEVGGNNPAAARDIALKWNSELQMGKLDLYC